MQIENLNSENQTNLKKKREARKQLVDELKGEWKSMWSERYDDKVVAEGVSINDYQKIRVSRGTVIHATRDFKALNFKEILKDNLVENPDRYIQPDPSQGGWNKFIKTKIIQNHVKNESADHIEPPKPTGKQSKKGGRGWLHTT